MADAPRGAAAPIPSAALAAFPTTTSTAPAPHELPQRGIVVCLAGADGPAIQQHPPRGRRPKHVLSLWRVRFNRSQAANVLALEAQHALALKMRQECHQRWVALSAKRKVLEELDRDIGVEYEVLARQVKAIEVQIAQAAKCGAA